MFVRTSPHETEHRISARVRADRMRHKPRSLLAWLASGYALEAPEKLHSGARLETDGDPAMTGEAAGWLGFHQGEDRGLVPEPDREATAGGDMDWRRIASRVDVDGKYKTPIRAALSRIADPKRRRFACELAVNLYFPLDVAAANDIAGEPWQVQAAIQATLELVWRTYADAPEPRSRSAGWVDRSESQQAAELAIEACSHRWEKVPASAYYIASGFPTNRCKRCGTWAQDAEAAA